MSTLFNEKIYARSEMPTSKLVRILNFMEIEQELIHVLNFVTFYKYLISGLSMNANDLEFKPHNIHLLSYHSTKEKQLSYSLLELWCHIHFSIV